MDNLIGQNLRKLRTSRHLTQEEFSKSCSISLSSLNKYERGDRTPKYDTLKSICEKFNVSIDYFTKPELMNEREKFIKRLHDEEPLNRNFCLLLEKAQNSLLTDRDIRDIDSYKELEILNKSKEFGGLQIIADADTLSYNLFKQFLKSLKYNEDEITKYSYDLFQKIRKQIELEVERYKEK